MKIEKKMVTKRTAWAKDNHPQMEIKIHAGMTQVIIIVAVDGWNYRDRSHDARNPTGNNWTFAQGISLPDSTGKNVRISMNGPLMLTNNQWREINQLIEDSYIEVFDEYTQRGL